MLYWKLAMALSAEISNDSHDFNLSDPPHCKFGRALDLAKQCLLREAVWECFSGIGATR